VVLVTLSSRNNDVASGRNDPVITDLLTEVVRMVDQLNKGEV